MGVASGHMTAVVFRMHAGDNCWHCYRLHYPRRPAQYIINVKPARSEAGWRGGAVVGRRTCDQEVASSIHGQARLRNDSGQVVHTQMSRR